MRNCLFAFIVALVGCSQAPDPPEVAPAQRATAATDLYVEVIGDLVTVRARDVTVRNVLQEIARQGDLVLVLRDALDERITLEFERLPLPEAMQRVLRDRDYTLQYVRPPARAGNDQANRLWVLSDAAEDSRVRNSKALAANEANTPSSLGLMHESPAVRLKAVSELADSGGPEATAALAVAALSDADDSVREEAVHALGEMGEETGVPVLEHALKDPDARVREAAIDAFVNLGGDDSARALAVALSDRDAAIRAEAVKALGEIGGETALRLLRQAMTDENSTIREAATELHAELSQAEE